nr:exo-alpha-sialidase [Nocardioides perillae]
MWVGRSDGARAAWAWSGPHAAMTEVYACLVTPPSDSGPPRLWAATASSWLGPTLVRSDDLGETWVEAGVPRFPDDVDASVERVWQLQPGARAGELWAGTEPGAVFRSTDDGETWELVRGLWDHPHRAEWGEGFGGQAFHTLLPHPTDPDRLVAAISTGGVYATTDGGATWEPRNRGLKAEFFPDGAHYPEFGQCVHKVARHPAHPERLFLQNHGGVYRSDDEGGSWASIAAGLPSDFGFPVVVHPHRPDTVHVFPLGGGEGRFPPEGRARVWRSPDAGATWAAHDEGLPDGFWVGVMRDAMTADDHERSGLWLGARNGSVWLSVDGGRWREVARDLPDVMCLRAARC